MDSALNDSPSSHLWLKGEIQKKKMGRTSTGVELCIGCFVEVTTLKIV